MPAALGCAHFPSLNSSDCSRRLLQSSPREPDTAKDSGEPLKQRQQMASVSAQCPSSVITAQGLEHTHGSSYHFCLVRQFKLYQENSLFIKLEKRPRHEAEPITPWARKRKLADKITKLQSVLQRKPDFFTLKKQWIQHTNRPAASCLGKCSIPTLQKFTFTQSQLSSALPEEEETSWFWSP